MSEAGVAAARELGAHYAEVVENLTPGEWRSPSRCAGWSVQDLVAHTGSNFRVLVVPPDPDAAAPEVETAEQLQELLVAQRRSWSSAEVAAEFRDNLEPALAALAAMQEEPVASAGITLTDLGTYPMHALADAFAFDLWCHLTVDLLAPGGPVDRPAPAADDALLGPAIGWMLTGLPQMCPSVAEVLDRPLGLRLTGPGGGEWTLVPGGPSLAVVEGLQDPAATATSAATDFVLWGTTRTPWRDSVRVDGDRGYAERVLDRVDIV
ncbi:maleylpyruvate isomerase family mycothiol-dependent enzyme [Trujillonella humicola]|uniref:maleylpyruvate isomerase family mycothiol-dependent enzyme n=1 Tax=Trujillonella humicola TaxID=3383699 RepID=UPI003905FA9A